MRRGPKTPLDPIGPVIKSNSDEHPRKNCSDDPEGVHLRMVPKARVVLAWTDVRHASAHDPNPVGNLACQTNARKPPVELGNPANQAAYNLILELRNS